MAESHGSKTERPSAKKLRDARKRGQIARSRDLSSSASALAATGALSLGGSWMAHRLGLHVVEALQQLSRLSTHDLEARDLTRLIMQGGTLLAAVVGPVALAAASTSALVATTQGGFNVASEALRIDWGRLSPARGFRKLSPSRAGIDTVKTSLAAIVIGVIGWRLGRALALDMPRLLAMSAAGASTVAWSSLLRLLFQCGLALAAVGAADYLVQRQRLMSALKMTRQEVKDEARLNEGNPEVKVRIRREQRTVARRRMLHATKRATVVITNPTHFAVALEYRREKNIAPVVVAKGRDLIAARIREVARSHGVPIVENPLLARALFAGAEIGDTIPAPLFGAVAEVLAYLIRIKQLAL